MGKWSAREYDAVLADKITKLFEHAVENIEKRGIIIPDKRFRPFIKQLDADNTDTQRAFERFILNQWSLRTYDLPSASTSMGPSGLPVPATRDRHTMFDRTHNFDTPEIRALNRVRAPSLQDRVSLRRESRVLPRRRQSIIDFGLPDLVSSTDTSPRPASLSGARGFNSRPRESGDMADFRINRDGSIEPVSPPSAASRAWLEDFNRSHNNNQTDSYQARRRRMNPTARDAQAPSFIYDSDATSVPDELDTLLDRQNDDGIVNGSGSGSGVIGRRRVRPWDSASDLDEEIRNTGEQMRRIRRRREYVDRAMAQDAADGFIPGPAERSSPRQQNNYSAESDPLGQRFSLPPLSSDMLNSMAGRHAGEIRDGRRDGVVFDDPAFDDILAGLASPAPEGDPSTMIRDSVGDGDGQAGDQNNQGSAGEAVVVRTNGNETVNGDATEGREDDAETIVFDDLNLEVFVHSP
ncbi:uncharacterized protein I303_100499 [Kwoniella dejecticola CBS 10117]|uniref:Uncharacterized protein n=1 Tax=Kwoniella dejecticola CBS 10117 TaxID=1296121 RepID=A0A1A6AF31_9TREE|nr:uncharacterized protein I303_00499 [Kwoniella dejecticola CBS 10117]OBR88682.1 hypothetical protein I303_00499 [Kwoniella dejecticola CBS 10117]